MRKIITFLGRRPSPTQYEFQGKLYSGQVFAEALRQFVEYDQMLVFVTDEARQDAWPVLAALNDPKIQAIPIPRGETTQAMWEMFDRITESVNPNETVIFDITHGLRSLPFLVFLFAAYLKAAKQVTIEAIYYGAFELGNPNQDIPAPVIDLSRFVSMLDWLTASDRFIRFGDSHDLADLLRNTGRYRPEHPISLAIENLEDLSLGLRLIRPVEAMKLSAALPVSLEGARQATEQVPAARPYEFLVEDLKQAYAGFALHEPFSSDNFVLSLEKQRDLIGWYISHRQWVQAVSLAREWYITWVMYQLGELDIYNQGQRESVAELMGKEAQRRKDALEKKIAFHSIFLKSVPDISNVLLDWLSLTGVRNDIDHAGMRKNPSAAKSLTKSIKSLFNKMLKLPLEASW